MSYFYNISLAFSNMFIVKISCLYDELFFTNIFIYASLTVNFSVSADEIYRHKIIFLIQLIYLKTM